MKIMLETFVKAMIRGLLYSVGFALIGGLAGLVLGKGFIQGAYMLVLASACVAMLVAAYSFIGSPKKRFSFFTQNRYENLTNQGKKDVSENSDTNIDENVDLNVDTNESDRYTGLYTTIIAVEMLIIGFIIEALLH